MIVNPDKHQAMVLGSSDYQFLFPVKNSIDLLGISVDSELSFNHRISKVCEKVNNQFSVFKRFKSLITRNVILRLYKAFVLPHILLAYMPFFVALEIAKFNDKDSSNDELLKKAETPSLYSGRIDNMLIVVFNSLFVSTYPKYLNELFTLRNSKYLLRGKDILTYLNREQQVMDSSLLNTKL